MSDDCVFTDWAGPSQAGFRVDILRGELTAERAKVKALREALERAQGAIGRLRSLNNPCGDQETERDLRRYQAQSYGIATRAYEAAGAALAATSDPEPEAPSDVHPQECGR